MTTNGFRSFRPWAFVPFLFLFLNVGSGAGSAAAATFTVTKEADSNDGACDADCSLREAIIAANDADGPDTINLPDGKFQLMIAGSGENNGEQGDLDTRFDALTINGAGSHLTQILVMGGDDRALEVRNDSTTVSGVTIALGQGGPGFAGGNGGGILVSSDSALTLNNSVVSGNDAVEGEGGGIYVDSRGSLVLNNATVSDNTAEGSGGGIFLAPEATAIVTESVVGHNSSGSASGAIQNDGTLTIIDSWIEGNTSGGEGGAIRSNDTLTVSGSTISGNTAGTYAAILAYGTLTMTNSTITENSAAEEASAIESGGDATLTNVTISDNSSPDGGAFVNSSQAGDLAELTNVIIARNSPADCANFTPIASSSHNLDSDNTCGFSGPGDLPGVDPRLGPYATTNGGPTMTHALLPGSPAIDAGDDAACPATDQRGVARPQGDGCDIGAFEFEPVTLWGDDDCDGDVDAVDALKTLRHVAGLPVSQTGPCPGMATIIDVTNASLHPWGDVDCDNDVDSVDALKLLRHVASLPVQQTQPCPAVGSEVELAS
jgi:CSLREA domain-containing protein